MTATIDDLAAFEPTADDWAEYIDWISSQGYGQPLPTPADFGVTAEEVASRAAAIGEADPFKGL